MAVLVSSPNEICGRYIGLGACGFPNARSFWVGATKSSFLSDKSQPRWLSTNRLLQQGKLDKRETSTESIRLGMFLSTGDIFLADFLPHNQLIRYSDSAHMSGAGADVSSGQRGLLCGAWPLTLSRLGQQLGCWSQIAFNRRRRALLPNKNFLQFRAAGLGRTSSKQTTWSLG